MQSYDQIQAQIAQVQSDAQAKIAQLQKEAANARKEAMAGAIKQVKQLMAEHGLTLADLGGTGKAPKAKKAAGSGDALDRLRGLGERPPGRLHPQALHGFGVVHGGRFRERERAVDHDLLDHDVFVPITGGTDFHRFGQVELELQHPGVPLVAVQLGHVHRVHELLVYPDREAVGERHRELELPQLPPGAGVHGMAGYRLIVNCAKRQLEFIKDDATVKTAPFAWTTDTWTRLKLAATLAPDVAWRITLR